MYLKVKELNTVKFQLKFHCFDADLKRTQVKFYNVESWYHCVYKALAQLLALLCSTPCYALLCSAQKFVYYCVNKTMSRAEQGRQVKLPCYTPCSTHCQRMKQISGKNSTID